MAYVQQLEDFVLVAAPGGTKPIPTIIPTPTEYQAAGKVGFDALWVVFAVMVVASAGFAVLSWNVPTSRRLYHVITTLITVTASLSYFAMASGQGAAFHCETVIDHHELVPDTDHELCRQVFWARYVDWSLTTPLLLLDLALLAGIDGAHTMMAVVADIIMILTGLFAGFGAEQTVQKWGWYTIACIAYIFVIWHVAYHGSKTVGARGQSVVKLFGGLAAFTFVLWTAYPIVWGVADGARKVTVDSEIIAYAVLDILAKPIFGLILLLSHRRVPETNVEIGGYWAHGLAAEGRIRIGDEED